MSMLSGSLFRPGRGQRVARYVAAYVNGTAVQRGDFVIWDTTAPTSQGSSGVLAGQTLLANDFIFVTHSTLATLSVGKQAGLVEGTRLQDRDTVVALANDSIAIVQTWGVFETHCQVDDTSVTAGDLLLCSSTVAGELVAIAAHATTSTVTADGYVVGIALTADAVYTRGTVTTEDGCTAFIRCDW